MKKRLISLLLVFAMVLTMLPMTALAVSADEGASVNPANPFTDVKETDWFYNAVQYARINGFFNGTSATTFDPNGTMTRGMFVTVLGRMAGVDPENYKGQSDFTDVPANAYYAPYVAWAAKYGITLGDGLGNFDPNGLINRAQMATFFVRYFEIFGVDYETDANITTTPADIDSVPSWAKDAVLKLWKQGLLNGDGKNFNPTDNANRAQAATICHRADEAVDTWYKEPGVPSERVKIDPATGETVKGEEEQKPATGESSSDNDYTTTTYYEVQFAMVTGQSAEGVTLPETKLYASGTKITAIPTPYQQDGVFLGWYYDADMATPVNSGDTVNRNMTLYAKMGELTSLSATETPNYMTVTVPAGNVDSYTFGISGYTADCVEYFTHVSNLNSDMEFAVNSETVSADYQEGQTYSVKLKDDSSALFVVDGVAQSASIRVLNIITEKGEVQNLALDGGIRYIPKESVTYAQGSPMDGLFNVALEKDENGNNVINQVNEIGTFTYTGDDDEDITIDVGDTVAIYEGTRPDRRTSESQNKAVVYVEITAIDGTNYTYKTADTEEVLFTPDVLPVTSALASTALMTLDDETPTYNLTVYQEDMQFTDDKYAEMGLDSQTTVDVGDFIAIYTGDLTESNAASGTDITSNGYGRITAVVPGVDETTGKATYQLTYVSATQAEVLAAMDIYDTRNQDIDLTADEIKNIEDSMVQQAIESGFVDEAAQYLTALAIETDGFRELSDDLDMDLSSYSITFADGTPVDPETMDLMAVSAKITKKDISANVTAGDLKHFKEDDDPLRGVRAELVMTFTVEVGSGDNKIEINLEAIFEQEVLLNINVSGGAVWKWKWIFPYIYDYKMNANIDVGTYTGIGLTATAKTKGADDEGFDWDMSTGNSAGDKIISIGKQIKDLMDEKEKFMGEFTVGVNDKDDDDDDDDDTTLTNGGLAEKYADMMENAEESWIDIVRVEIFATEGYVDMFHILCYGISADFVVQANLYVTLGMTFEFGVARRYNFSLMLFHKQSTSETIDLEEAHYQFDFYVMGTIGIRAGVEFEVAIGLFSLKLDSIGIAAEVGAYAQMWGYFYYSLSWSESEGKDSSYSGAMFIEIGLYLEISFKAQLFSSDKLTYQPTLYENQWPLWSVGEQQNVYDFAYEDDDPMLTMEVESAKSFTLSSDLFMMNYMDMKDGKQYGSDSDDEDDDGEPDNPPGNYDDATESHFMIELSNPKFSYDPDGNTVTVRPGTSTDEVCKITITWKHAALDFSSKALERTLTIRWVDEETANKRYINFDSMGGKAVLMISAYVGDPITKPYVFPKTGYEFAGWYMDKDYDTPFNFPDYMPDYKALYDVKGITVYAKWEPKTNTWYTVQHYQQQLNGTYKLAATDKLTGTTDGQTVAVAKNYSADGFKPANAFEQTTIKPDGSTVVKIYYDRKEYTVKFDIGYGSNADERTIEQTYLHGKTLAAPQLSREGYTFECWSPNLPRTVTADATYTAQWEPKRYTITFDSKGGTDVSSHYSQPYDGKVGRPPDPTRVGYTFGGWYIDKACTKPWDFDNDTIKGNMTLYAKWTANQYYVNFYPEGGSIQDSNFPNASKKVTYDAAYGDLPTPTRTGYGFAGWYTMYGDTVNANTIVKTAYDHYLYAEWVAEKRTVTFESNGGSDVPSQTVDYDTRLEMFADPTKTGYTFGGWYTDVECTQRWEFAYKVTDNMTLYAKWTINRYTVTWDLNGGSYLQGSEYTKTAEYNTQIVAPTGAIWRAGTQYSYTFAGWYTAAEGGDKVTDFGKLTDNVTYYAHWNRNTIKYTVDFISNGGGTVDDQTVDYGSTITEPTPTKSFYTLEGWYTDTYLTTKWNFATDTVTGNMTLYAKWTPNTCIVTFDPNGGSVGQTTKTITYNSAYGTLPTPTKTGYTFAGWYDALENGSQVTAETIVGTDQTHTLYARWTARKYAITYYVDGQPIPVGSNPAEYTYGVGVASFAEATKTGYTFVGWYDAETDGNQVTSIDSAHTGDVKLYARWTVNTYTISYVLNGGTIAEGSNPDSYTYGVGVASFVDPTPTVEGVTFGGWYTDEACSSNNQVTGISTTRTGNLTLYAKWNTDETKYDVWVAGVQVTGTNKADVLAGTENAGKVSYNPASNTLTLNGVSIYADEKSDIYEKSNEAYGIWLPAGATINLLGSNTIDLSRMALIDTSSYYGMYTIYGAGALNFTGSGSLTAVAGLTAALISNTCTFDGCTVVLRNETSSSGKKHYGVYVTDNANYTLTNGAQLFVSNTVNALDKEFYGCGGGYITFNVGAGCSLEVCGSTRAGGAYITPSLAATLYRSTNVDGSSPEGVSVQAGVRSSALIPADQSSMNYYKYYKITVPTT